MRETLYLIDAYAQIFRAYYAIRGGLRSPVTGEPTHAVFGITGMLLKLFSQFHPHYVVVALDAPGKTFRDDLFAEYKATRNATPDDLTAQIPRVLELIELFGIPIIGQSGLEADDVIACITSRVLEDPLNSQVDVRIVSKDKDLEQLLGERVTMFDIHTDTTIDARILLENKGITPGQVIDVLALTGDTVDNVPGVEGIGPKTAALLVQQFGSLDGILSNLDQITGKRRENLEKALPWLPLSRELVTLKCDAELPFTLDAARVRPPDVNGLVALFRQLGFNRFQEEVRKLAEPSLFSGQEAGVTVEPRAAAATGIAPDEPQRPPSTVSDAYTCITTLEQLQELAAALRAQTMVSVDTETTGLGRDAGLCGISLAWAAGQGVYVPMLSPETGGHLDSEAVIRVLGPVLEDPSLPKCGHNLKFDENVLLRAGITLRGVRFDSMLAATLIDPGQAVQKLDSIALRLLDYRMTPITDLIGTGPEQLCMADVSLDCIAPYAAEDADIALRLYHKLQPEMEALGLSRLLAEVEAPLTEVIAAMERNGILCDPEELMRQGRDLGARLEELRREIHDTCGVEFHIDSTKQLAEVLFDRLGLTPGKKTKTGRSTDIEVLEKLAAQADRSKPHTCVPGLIIEYRQLAKLIGTYLGNLRAAIDPATGRIHSTFHQLVTATGRLASHNPNLQNIPVRSEVGKQIRKAFKAPPGHVLICADYSQVELRVLAHCSGDEALLRAFEEGRDIHTIVAAEVFGVPLASVTRDQRSSAKTINFGIIYGVTPFGLARRIEGLDVPAATRLIADYKARFPGIDHFLQECVKRAMEDGYVTTLWGRRRYIPEIHSSNGSQRALGERLAINSVIQGTAADLIKIAMVRLHQRIYRDKLPMKLLLQIHDELVFETPEDGSPERAEIVRREMEAAMELRVPLRADCGVGADWLEAK